MSGNTCDVCCDGWYPIIDQRGRERYNIRCPECFGTGTAPEHEPTAEPDDWPPASTAASIKTMADLKAWQEREKGVS